MLNRVPSPRVFI